MCLLVCLIFLFFMLSAVMASFVRIGFWLILVLVGIAIAIAIIRKVLKNKKDKKNQVPTVINNIMVGVPLSENNALNNKLGSGVNVLTDTNEKGSVVSSLGDLYSPQVQNKDNDIIIKPNEDEGDPYLKSLFKDDV